MKLQVIRYAFGPEATLGLMFIDGEFTCYTLEDKEREVKIKNETCIPTGTYEMKLRTWGPSYTRALKKYGPRWFVGMLEIMGVIQFTDILIHTGNSAKDTAGCLLVGSSAALPARNWMGASVQAYKTIYPRIAKALLKKELVTIEYKNIQL